MKIDIEQITRIPQKETDKIVKELSESIELNNSKEEVSDEESFVNYLYCILRYISAKSRKYKFYNIGAIFSGIGIILLSGSDNIKTLEKIIHKLVTHILQDQAESMNSTKH